MSTNPNLIIATLVDLVDSVSPIMEDNSVQPPYITIKSQNFHAIRSVMMTLRDQLEDPNDSAEGNVYLRLAPHLRTALASFLPPAPPAAPPEPIEQEGGPAVNDDIALPATGEVYYTDMVVTWTSLKDKFGSHTMRKALQRLLGVQKLGELETSAEYAWAVKAANEIDSRAALPTALTDGDINRIIEEVALVIGTRPAAPVPVAEDDPMDVKLARQVDGNYIKTSGAGGPDVCWFCSIPLAPDLRDTGDTLSEQHADGCAVPMARQIIENYTAAQEAAQ